MASPTLVLVVGGGGGWSDPWSLQLWWCLKVCLPFRCLPFGLSPFWAVVVGGDGVTLVLFLSVIVAGGLTHGLSYFVVVGGGGGGLTLGISHCGGGT